jgi:hypothetical protein
MMCVPGCTRDTVMMPGLNVDTSGISRAIAVITGNLAQTSSCH